MFLCIFDTKPDRATACIIEIITVLGLQKPYIKNKKWFRLTLYDIIIVNLIFLSFFPLTYNLFRRVSHWKIILMTSSIQL